MDTILVLSKVPGLKAVQFNLSHPGSQLCHHLVSSYSQSTRPVSSMQSDLIEYLHLEMEPFEELLIRLDKVMRAELADISDIVIQHRGQHPGPLQKQSHLPEALNDGKRIYQHGTGALG